MTDLPAPIRHIVFDVSGVLIDYDPALPFLDLIPDAVRRDWFLANVCNFTWNQEQDKGRSWRDAENELLGKFPDWSLEIRAFRQRYHEMVPTLNNGTVAILDALLECDRYDITMLTNYAADTFREVTERFPPLKSGRGVTVSGEVGMVKPDLEIFAHHAATFELDTSATLFIDDSQANVAAARACGWRAIHFVNSNQLRRELLQNDIAVPNDATTLPAHGMRVG